MHIPSPMPTPSVVENIARQLTWYQSVFFLLNRRGLVCNINVVICLQNRVLPFFTICTFIAYATMFLFPHQSSYIAQMVPGLLLQTSFSCPSSSEHWGWGSWGLRILHPTWCLGVTVFQNATGFDMLTLLFSAQRLSACQHLQIISWSFGKRWFLIQILWKL